MENEISNTDNSSLEGQSPLIKNFVNPDVMRSAVFNEDCMLVMKRYPDKIFDLAIVDPPYGIGITESGWVKANKLINNEYKWDNETPTQEYFDELKRVSKNQIIWGGNYFVDKLPITDAWICWYKKPFLKSLAHFELAWTSFDMKPKMYEYTYAGNAEGLQNIRVDYNKKSIHPAEKPINIYSLILQDFAKEGNLILDTHLGSGSSRIACHKAKLEFVGCEISTEYFDKQEARFKNFISQQTLW